MLPIVQFSFVVMSIFAGVLGGLFVKQHIDDLMRLVDIPRPDKEMF